MKWIRLFVFVFISTWLANCQQMNNETDTHKMVADSLSETPDHDTPAVDTADTTIHTTDSLSPVDNVDSTFRKIAIREGKHNLSLQWISWEEMGTAEVKYLGDNTYSILGEQRSRETSDYLKIKGILRPVSEKELVFDGTVEHRITHLNQGQPCIKKGRQTFKSTKNRKYWRMQDMQNCEGGGVTDYVDIYF